MNAQIENKMLGYIKVASTLAQRALSTLAQKQAAEKQAADQVQDLIKLMKSAGVIDDQTEGTAKQLLGTHAQTMGLLKNAVTKIAELKQFNKKAAELGSADNGSADVGSQSDPNRSLTNPFVGQRTSEKKASDFALLRGLGLTA